MRKIFVIGVMIVLAVNAQEIPLEVQRIMDNYKKDSTAEWGFKDAQKFLELDKSIKSCEITVGSPFQVFHILVDSLEKAPDTVPVMSIVKPGNWHIPISVDGKYVYGLVVSNYGHPWQIVGMGGFLLKQWQDLRKKWPETSGVNPIVVKFGKTCFLHFPQKGSRNLFYLRPGYEDDSLAIIASNSLDTLDDSRTIFNYLKKERIKEKKMLDELRKQNPYGQGLGGGQ